MYISTGWLLLAAATSLLFSSMIMAMPTQEKADIAKIEKSMKKLLDGRNADQITLTPIPGLYEVLVGAQIYYVSADGEYLLSGKLFEIEKRKDLTTPKLAKVKAEAIKSFGEEEMVIFAPEKGYKHTVTIFTDIDCGYCRKLHDEIKDYNDLGIRVRYLMYPRAGIGSPSFQKAVNVYCADDRNEAMTRSKAGEDLDEKHCKNSVADQFALGHKVGVSGTPAIFLESGDLIPGYVPAKKMQEILNQKSSL
jgi:thiol:disulfide interchange protein DsbC